MKRLTVEIDEETAEALSARIDDAMPDLTAVAEHALSRTGELRDAAAGDIRPCKCGAPDHMAADPDIPVAFDTTMNEFNIVDLKGHCRWILRHCPSCGGSAPRSKRTQFFARIAPLESLRIAELCKEVETFEDAARIFGPPEFDWPAGSMNIAKDDPQVISVHRVMSWPGLSETADVRFTQASGDRVELSLVPKYTGPPAAAGL